MESVTRIHPVPAEEQPNWTGTPIALLVTLVVMTLGLVWRLAPEWSGNPDLAHGFVAPLVFLLLLRESRQHGTARWLESTPAQTALVISAALVGVGLFILAGLLAASVAWTHALVLFVMTAAVVAFWWSGLLLFADRSVRLLPFNWISFSAVELWLLVAPLPHGTYTRLTLALQSGVTTAVFQTLHVLGIPARQHGNLIELATTAVGVEDACSGVRSLISSLYAGVFFAAFQVTRPWRRALLIAVAPVLAVLMNFVRSLALTLLANSGTDITGRWHDLTGYAILTLTAAILAALAFRLGRDSTRPQPSTVGVGPTHARFPKLAFATTLTLAAATLALAVFFAIQERPAVHARPVPDLAALLPSAETGWSVSADRDLRPFAGVLQTTHLVERTYIRKSPQSQPLLLTVYLAYWPAGQTTVSRVAAHTPDACWPGAGWTPIDSGGTTPASADSPWKLAEHRRFTHDAVGVREVWFWHLYDGHPIDYRDPYSVPALLELALKYGFRRQGDQVFVRISSNRDWSEVAAEPLVRTILSNLAPLGL